MPFSVHTPSGLTVAVIHEKPKAKPKERKRKSVEPEGDDNEVEEEHPRKASFSLRGLLS